MVAEKINLTAKQWRMLEILEHWGGHGTCEVECQWGGYDFGEGDAAESRAFWTCRLVVANVVKSLVRRGLATDADGYDITDAGRAALAAKKGV